ncbi:glycine zipper 2TM domain-containing protein [Paraburkholderia azotifigens]|uniref:Glycine zipper 2TM domain-containing protein n=1 Tax=Paraburkholderia azotifigens TaxID=2057004 RepID=A0A5C6VIA5_9BURK|nr:glycine zipper 2TM domain-containing protein [Paraburkholderia azotifigens]TXC83048.1 glycine zipper 2TM domain-containing protein [Paraburkholderia azotifigens]
MNRSFVTACASALVVSLALSGCATFDGSANVYGAAQTQREETVRFGTVESVRGVTIDTGNGQPGVLGAIGGGALGAVAGSAIGGGRGSLLTGIIGGLAGAVAGNEVQHHFERKHGVEITVRLDDGTLRAITQRTDGPMFYAGERVRLLSDGGITRVTI